MSCFPLLTLLTHYFTRMLSVHLVYKSICDPCARGVTLVVGRSRHPGVDRSQSCRQSACHSATLCNGHCPRPGRWSLHPRHPRHLLKGNITPAISKESLGRIRLIIDLVSDRADAPPAGLRAAKTGQVGALRAEKFQSTSSSLAFSVGGLTDNTQTLDI